MPLPSTTTSLPPETICGYTVLRSPSPGTYIALASAGRKVFLKPLDTDCLLHRQLHPSIKERLSRVRELALKSAANLHGVERDRRGVFLVWEFIEGQPLDVHAAELPASQFLALLREVVLSIEALHQVGIVHGAMHARNVIVDTAGRPRLTHISPLLFHDVAVDETAVASMLASLLQQRNDVDPSMRSALEHPASLRQLSSRLVTAGTVTDESIALDAEDRRRRKRTIVLALIVAAAGAITGVLGVMVGHHY